MENKNYLEEMLDEYYKCIIKNAFKSLEYYRTKGISVQSQLNQNQLNQSQLNQP